MYAPQAACCSELFGTSVRYSGASIGNELASVVAGALAPIVAIQLLGDVDEPNHGAVAGYMVVASVLTVVAVLLTRETRGEALTHDRALAATEATPERAPA